MVNDSFEQLAASLPTLPAVAAVLSVIITAALAGIALWYARSAKRALDVMEELALTAQHQAGLLAELQHPDKREAVPVLLEEVKRIRAELGPLPDGNDVPTLKGILIPRVHSWIEGYVARAGGESKAAGRGLRRARVRGELGAGRAILDRHAWSPPEWWPQLGRASPALAASMAPRSATEPKLDLRL